MYGLPSLLEGLGSFILSDFRTNDLPRENPLAKAEDSIVAELALGSRLILLPRMFGILGRNDVSATVDFPSIC